MFFYGPVLGIAPLTEAIAWPSELALPLWAGALCASLSAFSVCLSTGFYGRFGWRTYMLTAPTARASSSSTGSCSSTQSIYALDAILLLLTSLAVPYDAAVREGALKRWDAYGPYASLLALLASGGYLATLRWASHREKRWLTVAATPFGVTATSWLVVVIARSYHARHGVVLDDRAAQGHGGADDGEDRGSERYGGYELTSGVTHAYQLSLAVGALVCRLSLSGFSLLLARRVYGKGIRLHGDSSASSKLRANQLPARWTRTWTERSEVLRRALESMVDGHACWISPCSRAPTTTTRVTQVRRWTRSAGEQGARRAGRAKLTTLTRAEATVRSGMVAAWVPPYARTCSTPPYSRCCAGRGRIARRQRDRTRGVAQTCSVAEGGSLLWMLAHCCGCLLTAVGARSLL